VKEFAAVIALFVLGLLIRAVYINGWGWLKTREGKGVLFGLIGAPLVALLIGALGGCAGPQKIQVFAGLEATKGQSPMCEAGGASDRLTSNLGVKHLITISKDGRTRIENTLRHHSCAITEDREGYDAFGMTVTRDLYTW